MTRRCQVEDCLDTAAYRVTNDRTDDEIPVCRRCAQELLARPGVYQLRRLD